MKTAYDVLGVSRNASKETIRAAFRKAAKAHHPDLHAGDPTAEQQLRQVVAAYRLLGSARKRAAYDRYLRYHRLGKVRRLATPAVAGLVSGSIVAAVVWLSVWLTKMQWASGYTNDDRGGLQQSASSLHSPATHAEPLLAREFEQLQAGGDAMAILAFAARNPNTPESRLAWSKLLELTDAAEDLFLLHVLHIGAPDATSKRAQQRLMHLGALAAAQEDSEVSGAPSSDSLEGRAASFVSAIVSAWSSAKVINVGSLIGAYADEVLYYGKRISRQAVLLDKRHLLKWWPERAYDVHLDSITVQCLANVCKVVGLTDWHTSSVARAATASGIAKFEFELTFSGDAFSILSEKSSVVKHFEQAGRR
jgi:curved DNA-binding protein CbpA